MVWSWPCLPPDTALSVITSVCRAAKESVVRSKTDGASATSDPVSTTHFFKTLLKIIYSFFSSFKSFLFTFDFSVSASLKNKENQKSFTKHQSSPGFCGFFLVEVLKQDFFFNSSLESYTLTQSTTNAFNVGTVYCINNSSRLLGTTLCNKNKFCSGKFKSFE